MFVLHLLKKYSKEIRKNILIFLNYYTRIVIICNYFQKIIDASGNSTE
jgi:hypothetical protein